MASKGITIYLRKSVPEEAQLLAVWEALTEGGRPQEEFRRFLAEGLRRAWVSGDLPAPAADVVKPSLLRGVRSPRTPPGWRVDDVAKGKARPRGRPFRPREAVPAPPPPSPSVPAPADSGVPRRLRPIMG